MSNVAQQPWRHGEDSAERIALRGGGVDWTYGRLRERTAAFAGAIRARGVEPGDTVLLVAPSVPEFVPAYYGVLAAGATVVAMNPMATSSEIAYVLDDSGCRLAIAWQDCVAETEAACGGEVEFWRLEPGAETPVESSPLTEPEPRDEQDTAVILYTSGTTGRPKGAELSHFNLRITTEIFIEMLELSAADAIGTPLPLFHVFGGSVVMGGAMRVGASLSLLPRFSPVDALGMIETDRLTVFAGVPTMYNALLNQAVGRAADISSLRLCLCGGASLPDELLKAFDERFGAVILEGYALTECTGAATFNGLHRPRKAGSVGLPVPGTEVRIVGSDGRELGPEEIGEVIIRGPTVMKGYRGRPEATAETIRDGWLYTGDLGAKDHDGDLRIVDRIKDLIIRGGYNVYPREVEEVLYEHPDVVEVAVVGVEDDHFGEEVAAVVALRPGVTGDSDVLRHWTRERLSPYKVPRLWQFVEALPKGSTGKILKRAIDRSRFAVSSSASA